ncbi:GDSL-type esterase/lipase family protein [Blastococcus sp. LR1]|uniref:GDSL-type esterase/lipase family protein n=1 Tax=Blastococcus sp. LR1 TaxID=2877000 RepID=UPI001CC98EE1|nr:GDSL-type esterase/lipase family protein [Blastococcus sp. LR1]MCA0144878.1 GDSL-type esterase/lipase family protein [Blastococcus sp. LR1]
MGDFDRVKRQQQYLQAMFGKLFSSDTFSSPTRLDGALRAVTDAVAVDDRLSNADMVQLDYSLRGVTPENIDFFTAPVLGTGRVGAASVVYLDDTAAERRWTYLRSDSLGQNATAFADDDLPEVPRKVAQRAASRLVVTEAGVLGGAIKLAALGDSITAGQNFNQAQNDYWASVPILSALLSEGRIQYRWNAGKPGDTSAQVLARVGEVTGLNPKPDVCVVTCGTNDGTAAPAMTNIPLIVAALRAAGIEPVLTTIPPSNDSNAQIQTKIRTLNGWLPRYASLNRLRLVNFYDILVNPATGGYKAGWFADVTHPNKVGMKAMAQALVDTLAPAAGPRPTRAWTPSDNVDTTNLITNGLMLNGTAVPTGWTSSAGTGFVESVVTDAAFRGGKAYECTRTATDTHVLEQSIGTSMFSAGDRLSLSFKMTTVGVEAQGSKVEVMAKFVGATNPENLAWLRVNTDITAGVFYVEQVVPASTTGVLQVQIRSDQGTAPNYSFRVGEFGIRNLTRLGIAT